jgi:hypothetical protein
LFAPSPNPKLEDHPLLAVYGCCKFCPPPKHLKGVSNIRNLKTDHNVLTRGPPNKVTYVAVPQNPVRSVELRHVHKQMNNTKTTGISAYL